jgi:hypothetical protein
MECLDMELEDIFGPSWLMNAMGMKNPADKAMGYYDQIPGAMKPYYDPYINAGRSALPTLQNQYSNLLNDPTSLMSKIGGNYQKSPGYQFQFDQGMAGANNAAAAGGMLGSPQHQQQAATVANGLANQDYYNYMNHGMSSYMQGLNGMSGLNQMGYNASTGYADNLAASLMNQGNLKYAGQANRNQMIGGMFGSIAGMGMNMM